jgi:hypothetical protein
MDSTEALSEQPSLRIITAIIGVGFLALGLLIGTLLAMSATSLAQSVIAALFALFGGSLLTFLDKVTVNNQIKAAAGLFAVSIGTLIGIYSGVYVNEHRLLSPLALRSLPSATTESKALQTEKYLYLRSSVIKDATAIDQKYRNKMLTAEEAYEKLRSTISSGSQESNQ